MRYVYLEKGDLGKFVDLLKLKRRVVAPVAKENKFVFAEIDGIDEVSMEYIPTILPPKKYVFPQTESLGTFNMGDTKISDTSLEIIPTAVFAAHTCDIDGLECLDAVFHDDPADPYYKKRRKSLIIIGYECMAPCDEHATCFDMDTHNPKAGYDIMITDAGEKFILHVNSNEGETLVDASSIFRKEDEARIKAELKKVRRLKQEKFKKKLDADFMELPKVFDAMYNGKTWEDVGKKCVSCGNCTAVCPTCYCFDIQDEVKLDVTGGERKRIWDSCQLEEFAEVSGGENFREERASRQRHRYYRKFNYSIKKFKKSFCTGCGRCTRACVADISLIETVNDLTKEFKNV